MKEAFSESRGAGTEAPISSSRRQEAEQTVCRVAGVARNRGGFTGEAGGVYVCSEGSGAPMILLAVFTMHCSALLLYSVQLPPHTVMQLE